MKDPWVAALLAAGGGFAAWSLYRQLNQQDYEELVSWKELKTQYLMRGRVCPGVLKCADATSFVLWNMMYDLTHFSCPEGGIDYYCQQQDCGGKYSPR